MGLFGYQLIAEKISRSNNPPENMMYKIFVFAAVLAIACSAPAPEPKPKADPSLLAAAYSAPLVAAPAVAYTSPYVAAPVAYSSYVAPSLYGAAYSYPYAAPYVVV